MIKKVSTVTVSPEDIVGSIRHLLNENAVAEMDKIKISLPAKQQYPKTRKVSKTKPTSIEKEVEAILADKDSDNRDS